VWLGKTLGWGTILATVLLALGLLLSLARVESRLSSSLAHAGLIVLMCTPVARVVVSVGEYARQRDWTFLTLTLTVLGMLLLSLVAGAR